MSGEPRQLPLGIKLRDSSVFASYYAGCNAASVDALLALRPESHRPAVWLYGPPATGKTHLLQALCARATDMQQTAAYFPLESVVSFGPGVLQGCDQLPWVCLDDVDAIAGRKDWEQAVFALYTELEDEGGRLVVSAAAPPAGVAFGLPDLRSRFAGGTVLNLRPLDESEQVAALRLRATQRGLELPDDTATFLLHRLPRDMQSLCTFLDTLDEASLAAQRRLTVPFVSRVLSGKDERET